MENSDGNSGFTEVSGAGNITELGFDHTISLYRFDQFNARFHLQAYNINKLWRN